MEFIITKDEISKMINSLNSTNVKLIHNSDDQQIIRDLIKCRVYSEYKKKFNSPVQISMDDKKIQVITSDPKQYFFDYQTKQDSNDSLVVSISAAN